MLESDVKVWIYWDPPERPAPYFEFCAHHIKRRAGFDVQIVGYNDAIDLGCWLPPRDQLPYKAHYADIARAQLIMLYGGITMDADALVLPAFYKRYVESLDLRAFGPADDRGYFVYGLYAPPNEQWVKDWVSAQKSKYRAGAKSWTAFGAPLLWNIKFPENSARFSLAITELFDWREVYRFSECKKFDASLLTDKLFVCLFNKGLSTIIGDKSMRELLAEETVLSQLIKYCEPDWQEILECPPLLSTT